MILIISILIVISSFLLVKYKRDEYLYIPYLVGFVIYMALAFTPAFLNLPKLISNNTENYLIASLLSLITTVLVFRIKSYNDQYLYYSLGLMLIGFNNKFILMTGLSYYVLKEINTRYKKNEEKLETNLFYLIPVIIFSSVFLNEIIDFRNIVFSLLIFLYLFIELFKLTKYRIIGFYIFLTLMKLFECNEKLLITIYFLSLVFLIYEVYKSFIEKGVDLNKYKVLKRINTICIVRRNSSERIYHEPTQFRDYVKKAQNQRTVTRDNYENDIRTKFLIMIGIYCVLAVYILVRT